MSDDITEIRLSDLCKRDIDALFKTIRAKAKRLGRLNVTIMVVIKSGNGTWASVDTTAHGCACPACLQAIAQTIAADQSSAPPERPH